MVSLLLTILVVVVVAGIVCYAARLLLPSPWVNLVYVIIALVVLIWILRLNGVHV